MIIEYTGSLPAGEIKDMTTGATHPFTRGQSIEVPDRLAHTLIEQNCGWQEPATETKKKDKR